MKIVNPNQMSEIDKKSMELYGIPGLLLMENAGIKCWELIKEELGRDKLFKNNFLIIAGTGNNGGDSLVIARQAWMYGTRNINIILTRDNANTENNIHRNICKKLGIPVFQYKNSTEEIKKLFKTADVIIDGITGTGLHGALYGPSEELVAFINLSRAKKISVDIPSGLGDEFKTGFPVVKADITLTVGLPKTILYYPSMRIFAGKIITVKIGFPLELLENPSDSGDIYNTDKFQLPYIPDWAYKGSRGHAAVFAGSTSTSGAAFLSSTAAGRSRSGLVTLFTDNNIYPSLSSKASSIMVAKLKSDNPDLSGFTSLLAGPGWGTDNRSRLLSWLFKSKINGVLDAAGLKVLLGLDSDFIKTPGLLNGKWVFTPHPGEFESLSGVDKEDFLLSPVPVMKTVATKYGAVIVLKSHVTFIVNPKGEYSVVDGMNPALGTGGSGDILSGIIAGFMAQGMAPYKAAVTAVILHQKIGKVCFRDKGWFLAEDLLPYISSELKNMEIL